MDPITIQIAMSVASQGLRMIADFQDRAAAGQTNEEEVEALAVRFGLNLAGLRSEIEQRRREDAAAAARPL